MDTLTLLPVTKAIYQDMVGIAWQMLGPLFLLSCIIEYGKNGMSIPAWELLRRLVITIILLCAFPEITDAISTIANALADRIGEKQALHALFDKMRAQTNPEYQVGKIPMLLSADFYVAFFNWGSFAIVYLAKFVMVNLYHFFWSILMAVAPLAILCSLFRGATHVTVHLFSSLIEISSWNVIWQIMAQMLLGMSFTQGTIVNYFDLACLNLFVAIGMIGAPMIVHSLIRQGLSSPSAVSAASTVALVANPAMKGHKTFQFMKKQIKKRTGGKSE